MQFARFAGSSIIGFSIIATATCALAADLRVVVKDIQTEGDIRISLYSQEDQWLKRGYKHKKGAGAVGTGTYLFTDIPAGEYAIALYQDVNGDGKLNSNLLGIPSEPIGFSNDARGTFGPPGYAAAKFQVGSESTEIVITLN